MLTLFLGAGFSKWAADLPVVHELFDFFINPHNLRDRLRLQGMARYKCEWDRTHPGMHPEIFIKDALASARFRRLLTWYVTRRLSEPFIASMLGGTQTLMIDDRRKWKLDGIARARDFLNEFRPSRIRGIVTCNYDLLVEYALGTEGFNYGVFAKELVGRGKNPWFPWHHIPVHLTGDITLAKLHGSISWDSSKCYTDGRCGVKGSALIVPPGPEKLPPEPLAVVWELAGELLHKSTHVLVFGFSFNPYDQAVLNLLRGTGDSITSVLIVNIDPIVDLARGIWPSAEVSTCQPPPSGLPELQAWIRDGEGGVLGTRR